MFLGIRVDKRSYFKRDNIIATLLCVLFSLVISVAPWDKIRNYPYTDRQNYLDYIDHFSNKILWFDFSGLITKIMYEWGWHQFLYILSYKLSLSGETILQIVSYVSVFSASIIIARKRNWTYILLLVNPIYIDFVTSQSRLAFAMSLIFFSYSLYRKRNKLFVLLLLASLFVHTSSILFIFMIGSALVCEQLKFISNIGQIVLSSLTGLIVSLLSGPFMSMILTDLNDRRADYQDMSSSVVYMAFWVGLYFYFTIVSVFSRRRLGGEFYVGVSTVSVVVFNLFLTGYPLRFLAACFPFIILAFSEMHGISRKMIVCYYFLFTIGLWIFWLT